ncbi:hypothetical protein OTSUT76_3829 [Orientia tsutsugamushi str. UT76]|nr:hypothetical protein OTSUT76_3829 [Orientia tsutsugamushi str. UT76]
MRSSRRLYIFTFAPSSSSLTSGLTLADGATLLLPLLLEVPSSPLSFFFLSTNPANTNFPPESGTSCHLHLPSHMYTKLCIFAPPVSAISTGCIMV